MKKNFNLICVLLTLTFLALTFGGCTASVSTNTSKPAANTATNTAKPASNTGASNTATTKKVDKPKPFTDKAATEKKPEGTAKTASKKVAVPKDWVYVYDDKKGYGF